MTTQQFFFTEMCPLDPLTPLHIGTRLLWDYDIQPSVPNILK